MTAETFLHFWTLHNEAIIQWLLFSIVFFTTVLLVRSIMGRSESEEAADPALLTIQSTLTKLIEQNNAQKAAGPPAAPSGSPGAAATSEAQNAHLAAAAAEHQREIQRREQEIQALKAELQNKPKESDNSKFLERIKELEGKLSEYEILEDDIADLSLFKEENTRLKAELEALKGQSPGFQVPPQPEPIVEVMAEPLAVPEEPSPAPVETPAPVAAPDTPDFVAEFQAAVESEPSLASPVAREIPPTGDILAEFSKKEEAAPRPDEGAKKA
jgi:hypothetical protein